MLSPGRKTGSYFSERNFVCPVDPVCRKMTSITLPRELNRWLQSLDLQFQVGHPKWDLSSGFTVAEILTRFYPKKLMVSSFRNGRSYGHMTLNWNHMKAVMKGNDVGLASRLVYGTQHSKEGASGLLLEELYKKLVGREIKKVPPKFPVDFTDRAYQESLPQVARTTAISSIRTNLRSSEIRADPDELRTAARVDRILRRHSDALADRRRQDPARYDRLPSLAERCLRHAPPVSTKSSSAGLDRLIQTTEVEESDPEESNAHKKSKKMGRRKTKRRESPDSASGDYTPPVPRDVDVKQPMPPTVKQRDYKL